MDDPLPFFARFWLAFRAFFAILFDARYAARIAALPAAPVTSEPAAAAEPARARAPEPSTAEPPRAAAPKVPSATDGALQLLGILQREGRLVDFLQQDIATFADADVGAAARVVHAGCRRALSAHADVSPVRSEAEGSRVSVSADELRRVKLVGNVSGAAPYRGVLRHKGWQAQSLRLPTIVGEQELAIIAQAEVEL